MGRDKNKDQPKGLGEGKERQAKQRNDKESKNAVRQALVCLFVFFTGLAWIFFLFFCCCLKAGGVKTRLPFCSLVCGTVVCNLYVCTKRVFSFPFPLHCLACFLLAVCILLLSSSSSSSSSSPCPERHTHTCHIKHKE